MTRGFTSFTYCVGRCLVFRTSTLPLPSHEIYGRGRIISRVNGLAIPLIYRKVRFSNSVILGNSLKSFCWKCGEVSEIQTLFCSVCKVIQKPVGFVNFFEILGVRKAFDLDVTLLTKKFRQMQMQLHPDRFMTKSQDEKLISAEYSALINDAYKTLHSPLLRGFYLLQLEGGTDHEVQLGSEFLSEIMEINEEINQAENLDEIKLIHQGIQRKMGHLFRNVADAFHTSDLETARSDLQRLKYYSSIQAKIKEMEQTSVGSTTKLS